MELVHNGLELLDEEECRRLLGTAEIGRIALSVGEGAVPAVLPVNYRMVGTNVMFFTGPGLKLTAAQHDRTVAFEVDDIDPVAQTGWSVLVVGSVSRADAIDRARAEALGLYPWAAGDHHELVRIRPVFLSGRRILSGRS